MQDWTISFDSEDAISGMWDINNQPFDEHHVNLKFSGVENQIISGGSKTFGGTTSKKYGELDKLPENLKVNGEALGELKVVEEEEIKNVQKFDRKRIQLVTELNKTSVIDISDNDADIILNQDNSKDSQVWSFILDKVTDSYTIQTTDDSKGRAFLSETTSGKLNFLHSPSKSSYWKVVEVAPYIYQLINMDSGHAIDVTDSQINNGTIIKGNEKSDEISQRWKFEILGGIWTEGSEKPENNQKYTIRSASNPNLFLHNTGSNSVGGIKLYTSQKDRVGQIWKLDTSWGNLDRGVVLENDFTFSGKYLKQSSWSNEMNISNMISPGDYLSFIELPNGNYLIYSKINNVYLDAGAPGGDGSKVTLEEANGQYSQQWVFEKVK